MKGFLGLLASAALVVLGWWVYRQNYQLSPGPTMTYSSPSPELVMEKEATKEGGVKVFEVSGANFRFNPATITVNKGETVRIVFTSEDMQHDFDITELGVDGPVTVAGETSTVEFTADQAGEFEYFCSVGQHRANGMVGKLSVTE